MDVRSPLKSVLDWKFAITKENFCAIAWNFDIAITILLC